MKNEKLRFHYVTEGGAEVNFAGEVLYFVEDGNHHLYWSIMDLFGIGNSASEAEESLRITIQNYLDDVIDNKTIIDDLRAHGFQISFPSENEIWAQPPSHQHMLAMNPIYREIIETQNPERKSFTMSVPASAFSYA
jgi:hypothetical protein